ncbi:ABC transporter permease [Amycolatopsis sp. GM8]|uniref:ABC transporter permease n=1 Tax=Amycolatopsis sp. GM8 TaxID=2896530 RepID=UPI001F3891CB|nr:ABC transporter permease [Amycolatopsis sp. GM8]
MVVFGAVVISFVLTNLIGSPADVIGGPSMTPDQRQALNAQFGYGKPVAERFIGYVGGLFHGDFGVSYRTNQGALGQVLNALPNTLILVLLALAVAVALALPMAIFSVRHRASRADNFIRRTIGILQGMPEFWLALMVILLLSVRFPLFPSFGFYDASSLVLPVISIAIPAVPTLFRVFRGHLLDVLGQEFVESMRARGVSEAIIVYSHVLRNFLGPSVTFTALQLGYLIGGSMVVETIFSWPGIGNLAVSSVQARDFAVVQSIIIVVATFYVILNLCADVVVLIADPRIRVGAR